MSKFLKRFLNIFNLKEMHSVCSECFSDVGLRIEAEKLNVPDGKKCKQCGSTGGVKILPDQLEMFFVEFFWNGSFSRTEFGGAARLASNPQRYGKREVWFPTWLRADAHLLEDKLQYGLFHYGPPLWRVGEIDQLVELRNIKTRQNAIKLLVEQFPTVNLEEGFKFFRIRKNLEDEHELNPDQYDSAPRSRTTFGRLDSKSLRVLYGSEDLETCAHECRITIPDECFVASLQTSKTLRLLDLASPPRRESETPFSSLELAVKFLFSASSKSYPITQAIARFARKQGFDGIRYPSYFSLVKLTSVPNIALFGSPISEQAITIHCINRAFLRTATYDLRLGPMFK